ncbi:MAG: hypothetical protein OES32_02950 [Acidobacteriota bacterium]|nr:hypothetical protein [Acidobacteriota bacterium]MDH3522521.1 hypothetical protein [Acidobacteriota bacterium]
MSRQLWLVVVLGFLLVGSAAAGRRAGGGDHQGRAEYDAAGRVVRTAAGLEVSFPSPAGEFEAPSSAPGDAGRGPAPPARAAGDLSANLAWFWPPLGVGIGATGMFLENLDGQGGLELVAAATPGGFGANTYWYALAWDGSNYERVWTNVPMDEPIEALTVAQVDGDPALEVLVATGTTVWIYDGAARELQGSIAVAVVPTALVAGDVDADGDAEIVVCDDLDLYTYAVATGAQELVRLGFGGVAMDLGQVDDDSALEIGITNGSQPAYVLDGATGLTDWGTGDGLGHVIRFGDLTGDGHDEAVGGFAWTTGVRVYDVFGDALLWEEPVFNLAAVRVENVEGDARPEVIYGEAQWGDVHVLDQNGVELWAVDNPEHGTTDIAIGDADGDGVREVLWGAGYTSTGPDYLFAADAVTHVQEWQSIDLVAPLLGLDFGDVDADGDDEFLVTTFSSDSGYDDGRYLIFDVLSHALEHVSAPPTSSEWTGVWGAQLLDTDADPQLEICMTTGVTYSGWIACFDGLTHAEEWSFSIPSGLSFGSLLAADVDGGGDLELVAGTIKEHTGAPGVFVYALDPETGLLFWRSPDLGNSWYQLTMLEVGDVDGDLDPEVVVASDGDWVAVLDGATGAIELAPSAHPVNSLKLADVDGLGDLEIVIGTDDGMLATIDPSTGAATVVGGPLPGPVEGIERGIFRGEELYVLSSDGTLGFYPALDAQPVASIFLGTGTGRHDSLLVGDFRGNGDRVLAGNSVGVAEVATSAVPGTPIFADGFESGDTSAWSATVP